MSEQFDVLAETEARRKPGMETPVDMPADGKTFAYNRAVINQLWPTLNLSGEERKLWHEDLSGLDQSVLSDAIRNVKRTHDAPWPQLKWILDEYRVLHSSRRQAERPAATKEQRHRPEWTDEEDRRIRDEMLKYIDGCTPSDYDNILVQLLDLAAPLGPVKEKISSQSAFTLSRYARRRFFPDSPGLSTVTRDGELVPMGRIGGPR